MDSGTPGLDLVTVAQGWARHAAQGGEAWCDHYWNSWQAPHRQQLRACLEELEPFASVLEVGCGPGANLRWISARWPTVRVLGMDVSSIALDYVMRHIPYALTFLGNYIERLTLPPADIVFTCYALAYCPPSEVCDVLGRLLDTAEKAVVLAEPMVLNDEPEGLCGPDPRAPEWRHDYADRLTCRLGVNSFRTVLVDPPVDRLNAVVVIRK